MRRAQLMPSSSRLLYACLTQAYPQVGMDRMLVAGSLVLRDLLGSSRVCILSPDRTLTSESLDSTTRNKTLIRNKYRGCGGRLALTQPHNLMRINRCYKCWNDFEASYRSNVCSSCEVEKVPGFPRLRDTVSLHTMKNVSVARLAELDKRVMLPDNVPDKDYVCGSLQNGKITDKQIDIT